MSFVEKNSRYPVLFETVELEWLHDASISAIDGIMQRAIDRGSDRHEMEEVKSLGIEDTSFRKGHDRGIAVLDLYGSETVTEWIQGQQGYVENISMEKWDPYIGGRGEVS